MNLISRVLFGAFLAVGVSANAEPIVITFDGDSDDIISLQSIDPSLPDLLLRYDFYSNNVTLDRYESPVIIDRLEFANQTSQHDVEVAASVVASSGMDPYPDSIGMTIDGSIINWIDTSKIYNTDERIPALPAYYSEGAAPDPCQDCVPTLSTVPRDEIRYIPFRWRAVGESDWAYAWAAFRVLNPRIDCFTCIPDGVNYRIRSARLDFVALGMEFDTNTAVNAGGGLCPADFDFSGTLNFLDVSEFLSKFAAGAPAADVSGDGNLNFLDVSEFLAQYGDCEI
jgi:hypothetical protein